MRALAAAATLYLSLAVCPAALAQGPDADQEGYYYPQVGSEEVFARTLTRSETQSDRAVRVAFVTQVTKAQLEAPDNPRFVIFAKGGDAEHMIIVALDDEIFATLFRARAQLAQLTANARGTEFFVNNRIESEATWFDLCRLLGFEDLVISDGRTWAHRVVFGDD